jgi:hypothetical protein
MFKRFLKTHGSRLHGMLESRGVRGGEARCLAIAEVYHHFRGILAADEERLGLNLKLREHLFAKRQLQAYAARQSDHDLPKKAFKAIYASLPLDTKKSLVSEAMRNKQALRGHTPAFNAYYSAYVRRAKQNGLTSQRHMATEAGDQYWKDLGISPSQQSIRERLARRLLRPPKLKRRRRAKLAVPANRAMSAEIPLTAPEARVATREIRVQMTCNRYRKKRKRSRRM